MSQPAVPRTPSRHAIAVAVFVAASVGVTAWFVHRGRQRQAAMPHTLAEAAERVQKAHPEWHVRGQTAKGIILDGFFVSSKPYTFVELNKLNRTLPWKNVVLVEYATRHTWYGDVLREHLEENGVVEGDFFIYGDASMYDGVRNSLNP